MLNTYITKFRNNKIYMNNVIFIEFIEDYNLPIFVDEKMNIRYTVYKNKWIINKMED